MEDEKQDGGSLVRGIIALALLVVLVISAWALYGMMQRRSNDMTTRVNQLLEEYNVPLTVSNCTSTTAGPVCEAYADITLPDNNTGIQFQAVANVLFIQENDALVMVKLSPYMGETALTYEKIPQDIKDAVRHLTILQTDNMVCLPPMSKVQRCYIATNVAPLGNGQLFYAPLFEIYREDDGKIQKVVVRV